MKRIGMLVLSLGLLFVSSSFADKEDVKEGKKEEAKFDAKKIVGKWQITEGTKFGEAIDKKSTEGTIVFEKDVIKIMEGDKAAHAMTYTLDTKVSPVAITMKGTEGPAKDLVAEGIVELKDGVFKLCYSFPGEKRPTAFESKKDSKVFLFVMKAAK